MGSNGIYVEIRGQDEIKKSYTDEEDEVEEELDIREEGKHCIRRRGRGGSGEKDGEECR